MTVDRSPRDPGFDESPPELRTLELRDTVERHTERVRQMSNVRVIGSVAHTFYKGTERHNGFTSDSTRPKSISPLPQEGSSNVPSAATFISLR